jgi:hypothetical protein
MERAYFNKGVTGLTSALGDLGFGNLVLQTKVIETDARTVVWGRMPMRSRKRELKKLQLKTTRFQ